MKTFYLVLRLGLGLGLWYLKPLSTISVISWRSVLLVEETRVPGENHRHVVCYWQTFITQGFIEYISPWSWTGFELTTLVVICTDFIGSCKSNYHTTTILVRLLSNYNIKYICTIYTRLYTCLTPIPRFALRDKVTLRLLKLLF
jgi:hypothetical protein